MLRHPHRRAAGFTLIELGIVLVVLALLAGGLLVAGRAMIQRGEVADLIAKTRDLAAASRSFKSRFSFFPGDLPNAGNYLAGVSAGCKYAPGGKVGNGLVDTATESGCALEHLLRAGLLAKLSEVGSVFRIDGPGGASLSLGFNPASNENAVRITDLACDLALELDAKLDTASATPLTGGQVQGRDSDGAPLASCVPGQANDPVAELLIRY